MNTQVQANFRRALALHQQGQLVQAQALYRGIIQIQPRHSDSWHLLGVIAYQHQDYPAALELIGKAIALQSDVAAFHSNYANVLLALEQGEQAIACYERAIELAPDYLDAHFNLGNVFLKLKRPTAAIACYDRVIELFPDHILSFRNRGIAFNELKDWQSALVSFERAIAIKPDDAETYNNRGNTLKAMERIQAALASYDKAIMLKADFAEAYVNRGNVLRILERNQQAIADYNQALIIRPGYAEAYNNLGTALKALRQFYRALGNYDKAITLKPDYLEAYSNRGNVLKELKQFEAALASYEWVIRLKPDYAEVYSNLGNTLLALNQLDAAIEHYDRSISLKPDYAEAYSNRGNAWLKLKRFKAAIDDFDRSIQLKPDYADAYSNRGNVWLRLKSFKAAINDFDRAIQLKPDYAEAHWNKALALLTLGDFEQGWMLYEWRWQNESFTSPKRQFSQPLWLGQCSIQHKTLLIHSEQGLGDTIQFCRYVKQVADLGAQVIFEVQSPLLAVFSGLEGVVQWVSKGQALPDFDYHCPLLSLPLVFKTTLSTVPATVPYLHADRLNVSKWRSLIGCTGFKIGIVWQGSKMGADFGRSFELSLFQAIAQLPAVRLISLQKGDGTEQLLSLPDGMQVETLGDHFDIEAGPFVDTASVMMCLDLVITCDTSIAHLAGALGVPVWVALPYAADWRWLEDRSDSPWYPTMRLFRQSMQSDWYEVFEYMKTVLSDVIVSSVNGASGNIYPIPIVPVSWGELIDKITILEIKSQRLSAPQALANVQKELSLLNEKVTDVLTNNPEIYALKSQLHSVNESLWDIEDAIRDKERTQSFDVEFIALARSVYHKNDDRARIKREINHLLSSELIEEKSYQAY